MIEVPIKIRRRIFKFIIARAAFRDALTTSNMILEIGDVISNPRLPALWTSFAVSYYRPFTNNNKIGPIPIELVPDQFKKQHNALNLMRNKVCGHTDTDTVLDDGAPMYPVSIQRIAGKVGSIAPGGYFGAHTIPEFQLLVSAMKGICDTKWRELMFKEISEDDIPDGKLYLNISEENDLLFVDPN